MSKSLLRRLHRWLALLLALPLFVVVLTGLVLSFEPVVAALPRSGPPLTAETLEPALRRADPGERARFLTLQPREGSFALTGPGGPRRFDLATGEPLPPAPGALSSLFRLSRGLHERLLLERAGSAVVVASTAGMLTIVLLGLFMGLPRRLRGTVPGWHKALGWGLAPLLLMVPLTGLLMAAGLGAPATPPQPGPPPTLLEAVRLVGAERDLRDVVWIRQRGPQMLARIWEGGELRVHQVTRLGLAPAQRAWPRLLHEGNWGGAWSGLLYALVSAVLLTLQATGLIVWLRGRRARRELAERRAMAAAE